MIKTEIIAGHLTGGSREFFLRMNELMEHEKVSIRYDDSRVTYFPDTKLKQQPLVLRCAAANNGLTVELKLNHINCYVDLIENMPDHIKELFRSIRHCRREECNIFDRKCGMRRVWMLDGEPYYLCSYKYYFKPDVSNPDDAEYFAKIIKAEIKAVLAKEKYKTEIDV